MAYDLVLHTNSGRDWSLGANRKERSLAYHPEMLGRDKVLALAKLVNTEIKHNTSVESVRERGKSISKDDAKRWRRFSLAWASWYARNVASGQPVSNATIADLERWRNENADWTKRLTVVIPLPMTSSSGESLTRPSEVAPGEKKSKSPWIIGLIAATFGALAFGKRRG